MGRPLAAGWKKEHDYYPESGSWTRMNADYADKTKYFD
jgi:hypothetical protein